MQPLQIPLQALKTRLLAVLYIFWAAATAAKAYFSGPAGWESVRALWPAWRSGRAWLLLAYSALGPGAIADVMQQVR